MVHETLRSWEPSSYQPVCVRGRSEGATVFTGYLWFSRGGVPTEEQQATSEYRDGPRWFAAPFALESFGGKTFLRYRSPLRALILRALFVTARSLEP